jgi:outer membrane protein OmpA-like peptidoglycan-associated protein/opacity protein-like surface antigen
VGVEGGAMLVEDIDFDIGTTTDAATVQSSTGWDVDASVGYDFGAFRAEAEVGYKSAGIDNYASTLVTPVFLANGQIGNPQLPPGSFGYAGGKTTALSFMVNGVLDFGDEDVLQGFVGGGAGVARVKSSIELNTRGASLDDSDSVFAWQAFAGVRAPLTRNIDVSLKYRFFNADNVKLTDITGRLFEGRFRSHSILGGLTFNFGAPPEPTPEPPAPTPTPVWTPEPTPTPTTEVVQCTPGPYIVFFDWDKSDITAEAAGILDNAISNYANCANTQVMLAGHADRSGSASYNVGLSQRRADSVKSYLSGRGIPGGVISTEAFGESRPRVATADGVRELQNRRVEISYGPGSGQ